MASTQPAADPPPSLPFPLQDGETVIQVCRRHWIYLWPNIILHLVLAIVPIAALYFLLDAVDALDGIVSTVFLIVAAVYLLYWVVRLALDLYHYFNDLWVITNQRLIDSYRRHPFDMTISTADLVNVQDMSVARTGVLRTMLDYGDVICQTASIDQDFMISGVPNPRSVQALVDRERDRERMRVRGL